MMKIRKNPYPVIIVIALCILVLLLIRGVWSVYQKQSRSAANLDKAEAELVELRAREAELAQDMERITTEHGIESEIVTKYNVAKDGERVVHILTNEEVQAEEPEQEEGFWSRFWAKIF